MPDWSYDTLAGPLYTRLPPAAKAVAVRMLGAWGASRVGGHVAAALGHVEQPSVVARNAAGVHFAGPVGVSADLASHPQLGAFLSRLGASFVEIGPVGHEAPTVASGEGMGQGRDSGSPHARAASRPSRSEAGGMHLRVPPQRLLDVATVRRFASQPGRRGHLIVRLAQGSPDGQAAIMRELAPHAAAFTLDLGGMSNDTNARALSSAAKAARLLERPLLACVSVGGPGGPFTDEATDVRAIALAARVAGSAGVMLVGPQASPDGWRTLGQPVMGQMVAAVGMTRAAWPDGAILAANAAVEPGDAVRLLDVGADLVAMDAGWRIAGPGVAKRTQECLVHRLRQSNLSQTQAGRRRRVPAWLGNWAVGVALCVAGLGVLASAMWRVLLPYDESFLGLDAAQLAAANPRLLPFLTHDRATLAGVMLGIGILYAAIAGFGQRLGARWARHAVAVSCGVGMASFFLFLAFGYFDPLHALITATLIPLWLVGLRGPDGLEPVPVADTRNDLVWHRANWGTLGMVVLAVGFLAGGATIAWVGSTSVFVPSDLEYLEDSRDGLAEASAGLVPVVAHDRAGFGGALVSAGLCVLAAAVWGIRRGARWLWWTFLAAGSVGLLTTTFAHLRIGYTDAWHLAPVVLGLVVLSVSLALLYPYMTDGSSTGLKRQDAA